MKNSKLKWRSKQPRKKLRRRPRRKLKKMRRPKNLRQ
jgi:hypothetical protein